jgi:putative membrane protein (TIGR04086 family)
VNVDRRAVLAGAQLGVLVAAGAIVVAQAITSFTEGDANIPLYFFMLGGLGAGGWVAARRRPESPLTHGTLAALSALGVLIVVITALRVALGRELADPVSLIFHALMAATAGIIGGFIAVMRPGRPT